MMNVLIPVYPVDADEKRHLWNETDGIPLCMALWSALGQADGVTARLVTDVSEVAEACARMGKGECMLLPRQGGETPFLPPGAGSAMALARQNHCWGKQSLAIVDYRRPHLSAATLLAAGELADLRAAPVISIKETRTHPARLFRQQVILGSDIVAFFEDGPEREPCSTGTFFWDWSFYSVSNGQGVYCKEKADGRGRTVMTRCMGDGAGRTVFRYVSQTGAQRLFTRRPVTDQGSPLRGISVPDDPENALCVCLDNSSGKVADVYIRKEFYQRGMAVRAIPFGDSADNDTSIEPRMSGRNAGRLVSMSGNEYIQAFELERTAGGWAFFFLADAENGEVDILEPLALANESWEVEPGTMNLLDRRTGEHVTGRQQLPTLHVPDQAFAVAPASDPSLLDSITGEDPIYGFPTPSAEGKIFFPVSKGRGHGDCTDCPEAAYPGTGQPESIPGGVPHPDMDGAWLQERRAKAFKELEKGHMLRQYVTLFNYQSHRQHALTPVSLATYDKAQNSFQRAKRAEQEFVVEYFRRQTAKGCTLLENERPNEALRAWRPVLREDPSNTAIHAELARLASSGGSEGRLAESVASEFLCAYEGETGLPFANVPNCIVASPETNCLFLSDIADIHVLGLDGHHLGSLGISAEKPRVLWVEPDVVWTRDFAPGKRKFMALDHQGGILDTVPVEALIASNPQSFIPLSMCLLGNTRVFLLMHEKQCNSRIVLQDSDGKLAEAATENDGNYYSFVTTDGESVYVIDYFAGKILSFGLGERIFTEYATINEYGTLSSMNKTNDGAFVLGPDRLYKLDGDGSPVYSLSISSQTRQHTCKSSGSVIIENADGRRLSILDRKNMLIYTFRV